MTGGQPIDGGKTVGQMAAECAAEGAQRIAVVTDEPEKYSGAMAFPPAPRCTTATTSTRCSGNCGKSTASRC